MADLHLVHAAGERRHAGVQRSRCCRKICLGHTDDVDAKGLENPVRSGTRCSTNASGTGAGAGKLRPGVPVAVAAGNSRGTGDRETGRAGTDSSATHPSFQFVPTKLRGSECARLANEAHCGTQAWILLPGPREAGNTHHSGMAFNGLLQSMSVRPISLALATAAGFSTTPGDARYTAHPAENRWFIVTVGHAGIVPAGARPVVA
jgi:hypothetical protein